MDIPIVTKTRILGKGSAAFEVSALGFGVMGMNYHRGEHPDKSAMIKLGFLTGSINEYTRFDSGNDNRDILPRFTSGAIRANLMIVEELNKFGRTRGITAAQAALGWLLQKAPWIVPIPGTTKLSHLEENLRTLDFSFSKQEWDQLEDTIAVITIIGDRYPASEQKQV